MDCIFGWNARQQYFGKTLTGIVNLLHITYNCHKNHSQTSSDDPLCFYHSQQYQGFKIWIDTGLKIFPELCGN